MTVEELKKLQPGDRVLIVNERTYWMNSSGLMDKWLGAIMTVSKVTAPSSKGEPFVEMEEDDGECYGCHWSWFAHMIEKVVCDDEVEYEFGVEDFTALL